MRQGSLASFFRKSDTMPTEKTATATQSKDLKKTRTLTEMTQESNRIAKTENVESDGEEEMKRGGKKRRMPEEDDDSDFDMNELVNIIEQDDDFQIPKPVRKTITFGADKTPHKRAKVEVPNSAPALKKKSTVNSATTQKSDLVD